MLRVSTASFLISISRRDQVALIRGRPVYTISEVALIPLSSQTDAEEAIAKAKNAQQRHSTTSEDFLDSDEDSESDLLSEDNVSLADSVNSAGEREKGQGHGRKTSTVAEDVIKRKGMYGRFTDRFFSQRGWASDSRRQQAIAQSDEDLMELRTWRENSISGAKMDGSSDSKESGPVKPEPTKEAIKEEVTDPDKPISPSEVAHVVEKMPDDQIPLLSKLLTVSKIFFGSKNFYFSYDYDLSRSVAHQSEQSPLTKTFDPSVSD